MRDDPITDKQKNYLRRIGYSDLPETRVLALCKMTPERDSYKINQETLDFIFKSIKERIPLTTSS